MRISRCFPIFGQTICFYSPVVLQKDYSHQGYILVFRHPIEVNRPPKKSDTLKTNFEKDDIPF